MKYKNIKMNGIDGTVCGTVVIAEVTVPHTEWVLDKNVKVGTDIKKSYTMTNQE